MALMSVRENYPNQLSSDEPRQAHDWVIGGFIYDSAGGAGGGINFLIGFTSGWTLLFSFSEREKWELVVLCHHIIHCVHLY